MNVPDNMSRKEYALLLTSQFLSMPHSEQVKMMEYVLELYLGAMQLTHINKGLRDCLNRNEQD